MDWVETLDIATPNKLSEVIGDSAQDDILREANL
jgi:hypothetical protein